MRIACCIAGLGAGGAERTLTNLAVAWADSGHEVIVVTLADDRSDFFSLPAPIRRVPLGVTGDSSGLVQAVKANGRRVHALRRTLRSLRPDAIVAFGDITNVLVLLATRFLGIRVVISERTMPTQHQIGRFWSRLRSLTYPWADSLVMQTERAAGWARAFVPAARVRVVANPLSPMIAKVTPGAIRRPVVTGLGRLGREKGFDLLIAAFAEAAPAFPEWRLVIMGSGPLEDSLRHQASLLGVADRVEFLGLVPHPEEQLKDSAVYALSSRYEGFPNALLEAMACGCAVVATDCEAGPAEIVESGVNGLLVPSESVSALAAALERLMGDASLRHRLALAAVGTREGYSVSTVAREWESLLIPARQ